MPHKMLFLLLLLIFFQIPPFPPVSASTGNGHFVGNNGDGYLLNDGSVILRDLHEQVSSSPWIGKELDQSLQDSFKHSQLEEILGKDSDLFLRKITDLNKLSPFLGDIILDTLNIYDVVLTDEELGLLPEDSKILKTTPGSRVQIANRFKNTIRISKVYWSKMNPVNKIALLIHEAFYSIAPIECPNAPPALCTQKPELVREITGMVFKKSSLKRFNKLGLSRLNIHLFPFPKTCAGRPRLEVKIVPFLDSPEKVHTADFKSFMPNHTNERELIIQKTCSALKGTSNKAFYNMIRKPYLLQKFDYFTGTENQIWPQVGVWITPRNPAQRGISEARNCEERIREVTTLWFEREIEAPSVEACF